ncbi:NB-ARC domain-containing protein,transcriptional regulator, luxR family [Rivularia sp. PCC 7116]|uniref:NB-ARC domain-containing protein n=1 Tax=Rivularia sp. PCC 7116 TaxID=373994 RepID=UPI00029EE906|nr:NB-ARC domain-containing protein [Rivularia sp. PCC 7116]AFY57406.1 NB-ARC domain-containing protein,transcriptional regulator, luxR family [Rivularia sp. PCC 7116]
MIDPEFLKAEAKKHDISEIEMEALTLAIDGDSTSEIAKKLEVKPDAVRQRLSKVYQKFQVKGSGPVKLRSLLQMLISRYQEQNHQESTVDDSPSNISETKNNSPSEDLWEKPDVSVFYGRDEELKQLEELVAKEKAPLICLYGLPGIGKSYLVGKLVEQIKRDFDYVIWRSLSNRNQFSEVLEDLLRFIGSEITQAQKQTDEGISELIEHLRKHRCLIVLDNTEEIIREQDIYRRIKQGYETYEILIQRIGREQHKSCLLISSREKPGDIDILESSTRAVHSLKINGLETKDAKKILNEKGLAGENNFNNLIEYYRGNPLLLNLVSGIIKDIFNKDVCKFMNEGTLTIQRNWKTILTELFQRLSKLETEVIKIIENTEKPVSFMDLRQNIDNKYTTSELQEAIQSLQARSLIEKKDKNEVLYTLQPMVKKYAMEYYS